jgi:integrase
MNERGLSKTTQRQAHAILRRALVVAEREGKVARNAAALVDPPEIVENHHKPLTVAEARKVLRALDGDPLAARWICALLLGMRQGECLGLRWEDVDFDGGRLYVRNELVRIRSGGLVMTDPKSRSSKRPIPFGAVAPAAIALERTERRGEFVFYGKAQDPRADWGAWKALLVRAGVCDANVPLGEMPALHAARTTTGSLLDEAGVSDKIIAEILGHSQVQITRRAYIHGNEDRHRAGLGALAELVADREA